MKQSSAKHTTLTVFTFLIRSLIYHWRSNLLLVIGCAIGAIILIGAIMVGDSLKTSLRLVTSYRLGTVQNALLSTNGTIRQSLADSLHAKVSVAVAPVLVTNGTISSSHPGMSKMYPTHFSVSINGVDNRFWSMGLSGTTPDGFTDSTIVINRTLADQMGLVIGDKIVLRFEKNRILSVDAPFALTDDNDLTFRFTIGGIAERKSFGDFSMKAEHYAVYNVFIPLSKLQSLYDTPERVSLILIQNSTVPISNLDNAVKTQWRSSDAGINVREIDTQGAYEIYSDNIFIPQDVVTELSGSFPQAKPVFTWFANALQNGDRSTPYSFITTPPIEYPLNDNDIALGKWIADDLDAAIGDTISVSYFVPQVPYGLREDIARFVVASLLPSVNPWNDSTLMPPFPGLADAGSCTEWESDIPINLNKIRKKDELYWDSMRGTPKAFISYAAATKIWNNRFGVCTSIRIPKQSEPQSDTRLQTSQTLTAAVSSLLAPSHTGLRLIDVKSNLQTAVDKGISMTPLFIGLSFFTIIGALMLIALLFAMQIQARSNDLMVLSATGFSHRRVFYLLLLEVLLISVIGTIAGILLSPLYTMIMLAALGTIWHAAANLPLLELHPNGISLLVGGSITVLCSVVAAAIPLHAFLKKFYGNKSRVIQKSTLSGRFVFHVTSILVLFVLAGVLLMFVKDPQSKAAAAIFFVSGALLLAGCISVFYLVLKWFQFRSNPFVLSPVKLQLLNVARAGSRSTATVAILACGLFILGTIQLFHHSTIRDPLDRKSGTGGFMWYGELHTGIPYDKTKKTYLLDNGVTMDSTKYSALPARLKDGDDASCFTLNRVTNPPVIGINQNVLDSLGCFTVVSKSAMVDTKHPWQILDASVADSTTIFAIADQSTIEWGLGKSIGDTVRYTDDHGNPLNIVLAAGLQNSILQGRIIISESNFIRHFPSVSGYRLLLQSYPHADIDIASNIQRLFFNEGLQLQETSLRLNSFNMVQNTYLMIFSFLGMIGLVLGCAGLGIVLIRTMHERRFEFANLYAQGFTYAMIRKMILGEQLIIISAGVLAGLIPALIASGAPLGMSAVVRIGMLLGIVVAVGVGSVVVGLRVAMKERFLEVLREE
jgi:ABC-type antimicrobial peptide transport system permease subunit